MKNPFAFLNLRRSLALCFFTLAMHSVGCSHTGKSSSTEVVSSTALLRFHPEQTNSVAAQASPYVILVSIDGYRYDYNRLFHPRQLNRIEEEGVSASSLKPIYPSKTFPNHYSIVTGLYADHHGIVSNDFFDSARGESFNLADRKAVEDGSWYFGEPLWVAAGKQGMLSASYFWVGAEADIGGQRPNYYYRFDDTVPLKTRVDQVVDWLKLPAARRPHFITLYMEQVDGAAHANGATSDAVREAVAKVDDAIGRLREGVATTGLPVNIIVVSDHGMLDVDARKVILLDEDPESARLLAKFKALGRGPQMLLYLNPGEDRSLIRRTQTALNRAAKHLYVYRRDQLEALHYSSTPRVGDLVVEPEAPYIVGTRAHPPSSTGANHGWDPSRTKTMHGIFYATGPAFKEHQHLLSFENVHVYPLILQILGLQQRFPIDGHLEITESALKVKAENPKEP